MTRALLLLWAAPWSLLGIVLAPFFDSRRRREGALLCEGARWPGKLGWRYRAITLGHVILCIDRADEALLQHELAHVRQYERWGPLFVPIYLLAGAWASLRGRRAYTDNHFEIAARREPSETLHQGR